jgi:PHD/YefM family antitoxin component YafN of YafNO toxin-antitoxin module
MFKQLISDEKFANIQRAQAGLTKLFLDAKKSSSFYRVLRNDKPLGVLIPQNLWEGIVEDLEALSSPNHIKRIEKARKSKKRISSAQIKKELGIK